MKRPFLNILIPFALGITAGYFLPGNISISIIASAIFVALFFIFSKRPFTSFLFLYIALFFLGVTFYENSNTLPPDHISRITPEVPTKVFLRGRVIDDPVMETTFYNKEKERFTLEISAYKSEDQWKKVQGLVMVDLYLDKPVLLKYGDEITAEGLLGRPSGLKNPGLFDYSRYLSIRGVYSIFKVRKDFAFIKSPAGNPVGLYTIAYYIRNRIRGIIDTYMQYPYSGFINAIMIGDRSDLPDSIKEDFVKTGTVHIIAISGLNLGIIAAIVLAVLGILGVPKRANLVLTLLIITVYSITAGSSPPLIRASIVFAICVIGYVIRRDADMLNSLAIAGFFILLYNPKELFDPSFQLSFGSVACIIIFTPYISNALKIDAIGRRTFLGRAIYYSATTVSVSIAAWIGTWPIVAAYFNIISPVSILANVVIVPALFVITASVFAFLCVSLFSGALAALFAGVVEFITGATFFINDLFSRIPCAYFRIGSPKAWFFILYYALLASLLSPGFVFLRRFVIRRPVMILYILVLANIFMWHEAISGTKGSIKVTFFDVGQGDAALAEVPSGGIILIDGGTGYSGRFDIGKNVIAPYLWNNGINRINALVVTHFHDDHMGGVIYILENFKVDAVIDNGASVPESGIYRRYLSVLKKRNILRIKAREGDILDIGRMRLFILNPKKDKDISGGNDDSIVMKLVAGKTSVLFCGDIQEEGIARLSGYGKFLQSDIVKIPHHGSSLGSENSVRNFLEIVSPKTIVISKGQLNYGRETYKSVNNVLTTLNIKSYETNRDGAVVLCGE